VPLVARLYSLYYKMESIFDASSLLSRQTSLYSEEGSSRQTTTTKFDRAARRASFEVKAETSGRTEFPVPIGAQDGLATMYALRAKPPKLGERFTIPVADNGEMYAVGVTVLAPESVSVPMGSMQAWRYDVTLTDSKGQPAGKNTAVWISNDARRLPVKLQAGLAVGDFVLALRDAR
jgi:hypothetical protein